MTTSSQPAGSRRLLLHLLLLTAVRYKAVRGQTFNCTLMPATCESGLLQDVDNIIIQGVVDMQGTADRQTLYSLDVESTFDNQSFAHVCSTKFQISDCVNTTMYGCYCTGASATARTVHVFVKQRATADTNGSFYRLRFNWENSSRTEQSVFVRIPTIYGEANSSLRLNDTMFNLSRKYTCTLGAEHLNIDTHIMFCTKNLNMPVLIVAFDEYDITYYVNQECALYKVKPFKNSSRINFSYMDSCKRSYTFMCYVGGNTVIGSFSQKMGNNTISILTGAAMALVLFISVVFSLCSGIRDNTDVRIVSRDRRYDRSLVDTSSDVESSHPVDIAASSDRTRL